jgi:hypothetical protein
MFATDQVTAEPVQLKALEAALQKRLGSRIRNLEVRVDNGQLILLGQATSYHAKQLAQHFVMVLTQMVIGANKIEVR